MAENSAEGHMFNCAGKSAAGTIEFLKGKIRLLYGNN